MPFVKLDCEILESSLWDWTPERHLFITALLMAKPISVIEPAPQLRVYNLEQTGFVVPPGKYGFVNASGAMIIKKALVLPHPTDEQDSEFQEGMQALQSLGEPDPDSRSQAFEGRRLVRIDGGYIVLNYNRFRDKDYTTTERKRKQRERQKSHHVTAVTPEMSHHVTQAEAYASANRVPANSESKEQKAGTRVPEYPSTRSLREELTESLKDILPPNEMARNGGLWRQRINECPQAVAYAIEDFKVRTPDQRAKIRNLPAWLTDRHKRNFKELNP